MKRRLTAWITVVCMLTMVLMPGTGVLAEENAAELQETPAAVETQAPAQEPAPAAVVTETQTTAPAPVEANTPEKTTAPETPAADPVTPAPASDAQEDKQEKSSDPAPLSDDEPETPVTTPETPSADPETPSPDPETPSADPETPSPDPVTPSPDPETPAPDPETPSADPETPAPDPETPPTEPEQPEFVPESDVQVSVSAGVRSVFAGEGSIPVAVSIQGSYAPFTVSLSAENGGESVCQESMTVDAAGNLSFAVIPTRGGDYSIRVIVRDAVGGETSAAVRVPVAVHASENAYDWEVAIRKVNLTGNWREDLINIARTQIGYAESAADFVIDENGNRHGYTRYGDVYGAPYDEWCAMFISFCLSYTDISASAFPRMSNCTSWAQTLKGCGAFEDDGYVPMPGDLIFFANDGKEIDHMGIVEQVSEDSVYTIEGNASGLVCRKQYALTDGIIAGYGSTGTLMAQAGVEDTTADADIATKPVELPEGCTAGMTTHDKVNMRAKPTTASTRVKQIPDKGTEVAVLRAEEADGEVWYFVQWGAYIGYIRGDLMELTVPEQPEAPVEPEETAAPEETTAPEETDESGEEDDYFGMDTPVTEPEETTEPENTTAPENTTEPEEEDDFFGEAPAESTEPDEGAEPDAEDESAEGDGDMPAALPEITGQPEDAAWVPGADTVTFTAGVTGATHYTWQQGVIDETGAVTWTDLPDTDSATVEIAATMENLACAYRCVAQDEAGNTVVTDGVTMLSRELVDWMHETDVTEDMLARAICTGSLNLLTIEGDELVYVRTGKAVARIDRETNCIVDDETGLIVAFIDADGSIVPIVPENAE